VREAVLTGINERESALLFPRPPAALGDWAFGHHERVTKRTCAGAAAAAVDEAQRQPYRQRILTQPPSLDQGGSLTRAPSTNAVLKHRELLVASAA
jgi:hypothetical protein